MRPASLAERFQFYAKEFPIESIRRWFQDWKRPIVLAVIIGRHSKIFPFKYRNGRNRTILIDDYDSLNDLKKYCEEYLPESVYYDRNVYRSREDARHRSKDIAELGRAFGQQLPFDIDPENFQCPIHGTLESKTKRLQGLSFCRIDSNLPKSKWSDFRMSCRSIWWMSGY